MYSHCPSVVRRTFNNRWCTVYKKRALNSTSADRIRSSRSACTLVTLAHLYVFLGIVSSFLRTTSPTWTYRMYLYHFFCLSREGNISCAHLSQNYSLASCIIWNHLTSCKPVSNFTGGTPAISQGCGVPHQHTGYPQLVCCYLSGLLPAGVYKFPW